jgi:hypothetical protein
MHAAASTMSRAMATGPRASKLRKN